MSSWFTSPNTFIQSIKDQAAQAAQSGQVTSSAGQDLITGSPQLVVDAYLRATATANKTDPVTGRTVDQLITLAAKRKIELPASAGNQNANDMANAMIANRGILIAGGIVAAIVVAAIVVKMRRSRA